MRQQPSHDDLILEYRKTIRPLYAFVSRRVGGDRALAEDLVQETWMRAVESWPRRGTPSQPLAWLQRVARNTLASHFRRMRPEPVDPATIDLEDDRFSPDTPDAALLVGWGMARMRRSYVELIEAYHFQGMSVAEIADERGMSERAVEGRLRRARIKLRQQLKPLVRPQEGGIEDGRQTRAR